MFDLWKLARITIATALVSVAFATSPASAQQAPAAAVTDTSPTGELSFWNKIKDGTDTSSFKTYLETFPNGMFYEVAMAKFKSLGGNVADLKAVAQDKSGATNSSLKVKSLGAKKALVFTVHTHVVLHKAARRPLLHKARHRHVIIHRKRKIRKKLLPPSVDPFARIGGGSSSGGGGGGSSGGGGGGSGGGGGWSH